MKHMRAFGAHVSVRRGGSRPIKTDPHYYDGRFLRFAATTRNIVYFDTTTKREKTARHCAMDEFHYGTRHANRPTGAQSLLDKIIPNHTPPIDKSADTLDLTLPELIDTTDITPPLALDTVTDTAEHTITANAAQLLTGDDSLAEDSDIDDSTLPDLIDTRLPSAETPMNKLSPLTNPSTLLPSCITTTFQLQRRLMWTPTQYPRFPTSWLL